MPCRFTDFSVRLEKLNINSSLVTVKGQVLEFLWYWCIDCSCHLFAFQCVDIVRRHYIFTPVVNSGGLNTTCLLTIEKIGGGNKTTIRRP